MSRHPYESLPDHAFWRRSVARPAMQDVDPVISGKFKLAATDRIATAGSCFAQHIAAKLTAHGFTYYVTETVHPTVAKVADEYNYGTFTARYGNIYTARQLWQLLQRAYGSFSPQDEIWAEPDGRFRDPYRPEIQPRGFASKAELLADRQQHFRLVREAFEMLDVFIFTLGLTEAWVNVVDGAVYPLCPGVAGGVFDETRHRFVNFDADEVASDLSSAFSFIKLRNPSARFIVTVSPVPLVATYEPRSVLQSTAYSKAVLLVAAQKLSAQVPDIAYFPAYEIVTGPHTRGGYFAGDLRSVTEAGVDHVMKLFFRHYAEDSASAAPVGPSALDDAARQHAETMREVAAVICDEMRLDQD